jgi:hypothetical protein
MRRLGLVALLPACLSAPTGRDPGDVDASGGVWPPANADIAAIAAGDVDGDGKDDLVVADAGNDRIHLLRGGGDLDPTRPTVTTSTLSASMPGLVAPVAIHVARVGAARFIVVADSVVPGPRIAVFDMSLRPTSATPLSVPQPPTGSLLTINASTFGVDMNATFFTVPTAAAFIEGSRLGDPAPQIMMVPPTGPSLDELVGVSGYVAPGPPPAPRIILLEPERTHVAEAVSQGNFAWTTPRDAGEPWLGQIFADITGDQRPDVLGFEPNGGAGARLCLLDVHNAPTAPLCYQTPFGMNDARLAVGSLTGVNQKDVALLDVPPGGSPSLFLVSRLRVMTGQLLADGASDPMSISLGFPLHAILQLDGGPAEVVVMGRNGAVACARAMAGEFRPCDQVPQ